MRLISVAPALCIILLTASSSLAADHPPNVVLIFADDLGYGDVGCYGATKIQTPNIDKLAAEGRRFTDAHSASAVCTPSRYGLLTGEYPSRKNIWGPAPVTSPLLVDTDQLTIADVFKNDGYSTGAFGKWHLGFGKGTNEWKQPFRPGPLDLGFDYYFGVPLVNSAPPYVFVENDRVVGRASEDPLVYLGRKAGDKVSPITPLTKEHGNRVPNFFGGATEAHKLYNDFTLGTTLAERATRWIGDQVDKPFFLYLSTTNIHHPFTPAPRFQGTSQCGLYGDFVHELDWIVGEVMTTLEAKGVADNTLVIFTSDNGGMFNHGGQKAFQMGHQQNGDLLGFKFGVWEGGHRVPLIARWPGHIKPGTTSTQLISGVDMLATFAALTQQDLDRQQLADSVNVLPALIGEPESPLRDTLVLSPHKQTHLAIRKGKWVYIGARGSGGFGGKPGSHAAGGPVCASFVGSVNSDFEAGKYKADAPRAQLYDLQSDVKQTRNLHNEYPEIVKEMSELLESYAPPKRKPAPVKGKPRAPGNPAKKIPAVPSTRSASFDFESGKLDPWKVIKGKFGHSVGSRDLFFRDQGEYNKQGKYYLTTLESSADADRGLDPQTGVIFSPQFIPKAGSMTFRVGGGSGKDTYVALCTADGEELLKAHGINNQVMQKVSWDLAPYAGKKLFLKVVDQAAGGWGHITADDFQFDAEVLKQSPEPTALAAGSANRGGDVHQPAASVSRLTEPQSNNTRPNFVVIFTDDQGYADLSCFGGKHVNTPRIDQMAAEGMKLTSFYVAAPLCTPSRAALMTGCYPRRIDMAYGSDFAVLLAADKKGLNPEEITIAEVLKSAGYKTGMFGKWHLGDQPEFLPTRQGFDQYFGIPYSHDIHPFHPRQSHFKFPPLALLDNEEVIEMDPDADYLTQRITQRAVKFIEESKDEPFFLYVPHPIPHAPLHVSPEFMAKAPAKVRAKLKNEKKVDYGTRRGLFGQAISEIDWSVGQILDALNKNGLDENTFVMFTSDNGPANGKATPLRGKKGSTFEGGMREPTVIRWPGKISAGQVNDEIMTAMDLLPTFAKLAGAKIPTDRTIDGKDIWPTLTGKAGTPYEAFFYYRDNSLNAVRSGIWKLHLKDGEPTQLCNLETDIGEKKNFIKAQPEVVQRLVGYVKVFEKDIAADNRPAALVKNSKPLAK
ncbi:sulfatase-like hydrolase/transferase [Stieleria marina]|uniref:Arylsulfatase n=1 Tax=Stieleria marina TaxID=1930275 RepID=A0A517NMD3_9BACT|nr:Arylsulfatase [Planctomycetes bacterium K23_9]